MSGVRPLAFPDPPAANCSAGTDEISQFLCKELLRMLRFYDRVEPAGDSRKRPQRYCLPHSTTASALQMADYAAQWLACGLPCQRFSGALASTSA